MVVGAGVSGLTCAVRLLEAGWDVHVVARERPEETVSLGAGAIWEFPPARSASALCGALLTCATNAVQDRAAGEGEALVRCWRTLCSRSFSEATTAGRWRR